MPVSVMLDFREKMVIFVNNATLVNIKTALETLRVLIVRQQHIHQYWGQTLQVCVKNVQTTHSLSKVVLKFKIVCATLGFQENMVIYVCNVCLANTKKALEMTFV